MIGLNKIGLNQVQLNRLRLNAPFPTCRKMAGGGGSGDGFPVLPGDVTRWHFGGLTNEMMAAMDDPRIEDADGKGRFLSFKNFAWKGMSGVGGYAGDFSKWMNNRDTTEIGITKSNLKVIIDVKVSQGAGNNIVYINKSYLGTSNNVTIKITSTYPEGVMKFANSASNKYLKLPSNGVITLQDNPEYTRSEMYLHLESADLGQITIEQLPLYPGALVFDGVDDYGTCNNFPILTKEKGYTVVVLRQWDQDFLNTTLTGGLLSTRNYSTGEGVAFEKIESSNKGYWNLGAGGIIDFAKSPFTWQTSKQYNNVGILKGDKNHGKPLCVGCGLSGGQQCGRFAIWELVFLDHDATEEELTKIKDYFIKTYPWLFPDQAWTVVGKTNEDEDRATIANITGNGNDLVLSNLGFAEGSGYGLYKLNFNNWFANSGSGNVNIVNVVNPHKIVLEQSQEAVGAFFLGKNVSYSGELKISVSNKPSDIELSFGSTALGKVILNEGINIVKINPVNTSIGFFTNKAFEAQNIIIEQIPEYEGYLVTDGVDDSGRAVGLTISKDFTLVGEWILFSKTQVNAGLSIHPQIHIFNRPEAIQITFRTAGKTLPVKSLKVICSDGRCYDENWSELKINVGEFTDNKGTLFVASNGTNCAQIAFKNLGIYDNQILSKDDCIKAYNYLQTLKAK